MVGNVEWSQLREISSRTSEWWCIMVSTYWWFRRTSNRDDITYSTPVCQGRMSEQRVPAGEKLPLKVEELSMFNGIGRGGSENYHCLRISDSDDI